MLKMVDCAIAVCALKTNETATNNPEKNLVLFTVFTRLSFECKKKAQLHQLRCPTGRRRLQKFLLHNSVQRKEFLAQS